jgi:hypothetical protein
MGFPLLHIQTGHGGFTMPLTFQPVTIGRSPDNIIHLNDDVVSAHHCIVLRMDDEVHVLDLRSHSGTLINGAPVRFARLGPSDVLRVGHAQIRLTEVPSRQVHRAAPSSGTGMVEEPQKEEEDFRPPIPVIPASELRESVTGKLDDSGAPIKVVPDPSTDTPRYLPPPRLIGELLLPREMDGAIRAFLRRPAGMVMIAGPTDSGRTTTAYAMLRHLAAAGRRIVTFEQPPELQLENTVQIFIHDVRQYAEQIERMLRGEPGVLFLGEPPTIAAANAALRAAVGRCLVICIVDAADAMDAMHRWLERGVQPRLLAAGLGLVLSQRLVRRLCDQCKSPAPIEGDALRKLSPFIPHIEHIYVPDTCPVCNNTGYVGRLGVFEVLQVGDLLRAALLMRHPSADDLRKATDVRHHIPLPLSAYARVAQGLTTLEEADAIAASPPAPASRQRPAAASSNRPEEPLPHGDPSGSSHSSMQ